MELLKRLEPGDDNLLVTAKANALIDAINALLSLQVIPAAAGTIKIEKGLSTLEILTTGIPDQTITINNDDADVTITGTVLDGLITLNFVWTTDACA